MEEISDVAAYCRWRRRHRRYSVGLAVRLEISNIGGVGTHRTGRLGHQALLPQCAHLGLQGRNRDRDVVSPRVDCASLHRGKLDDLLNAVRSACPDRLLRAWWGAQMPVHEFEAVIRHFPSLDQVASDN